MSKPPISPFGWEYINDLSAIPDDKTDVVDILLHRADQSQIYTWLGPLLLAVNPEATYHPDLFNDSRRREYSNESNKLFQKSSPHIYAIAARARYRLIQGLGKVSQVIVISGESGTGKTFNSRKILDFLAGMSSISSDQPEKSKSPSASNNVVREISQIWPLISAFSTAATAHNSRSSRHGQLIQLQYKDETITGARVNSFLLERTRVTMEDRNFEIFYQLMSGMSKDSLNSLGLSPTKKYVILGETRQSEIPRYRADFQETLRAMETLGFSNDSKDQIFEVLGILLHLGNIGFRERSSETFSLDDEEDLSSRAIKSVCRLAGLGEQELNELLTSTLICPKSTRRRHTLYRRGLRTRESCRRRLFSIIRWIYDRLFHWLVDRINDVISSRLDDHRWLGILDIFGFESFPANGMEQLCINYATERLQLFFMENYLVNEQQELENEGLIIIPPPPTISVYRNRLAVIEQSVFSIMNDAVQSPLSPDLSALIQQLRTRQSNGREFLKPRDNGFAINHYSCQVDYNIQDIVEKNEDKVPLELSTTFYESGNSLLKVLAQVPEDVVNDNGKIGVKRCTTLSKLKSSMDSLMMMLNECDNHYVRCVRPRRVSHAWQREEFRGQLACSGILDALPLAKCKFPIRLTYEEFAKRYSLGPVLSDFKLHCQMALEKMNGSEVLAPSIHLGQRQIFITETLFSELESLRRERRSECANKIAAFWLKHKSSKSSKIEKSGEFQLKPKIIVISSSISGDDDVFNNSEIPEIPVNSSEINNNIAASKFIPKIAVNDVIIESWGAMTMVDGAGVEPQEKRVISMDPATSVDVEAGWRGKDLYVAEWLESISPPSEPMFSDISQLFPVSADRKNFRSQEKSPKALFESSHVFDDFKETKWSRDGESCVIYLSELGRLFYRSRMLSRRWISESPVRFHTRRTCLGDSHCLPRAELPQGLQDCL